MIIVILIMNIDKPKIGYIKAIKKILAQWTNQEEVDKYITRIQNEIKGISQFGMQFWVIRDQNEVIGVGGLADILPKISEYSQTSHPCEIKILYLDKTERGKGFGKIFLEFLEKTAKDIGKEEILIRSALLHQDTAWGFYEKHGYKKCGTIDNDMAVFRKIILSRKKSPKKGDFLCGV